MFQPCPTRAQAGSSYSIRIRQPPSVMSSWPSNIAIVHLSLFRSRQNKNPSSTLHGQVAKAYEASENPDHRWWRTSGHLNSTHPRRIAQCNRPEQRSSRQQASTLRCLRCHCRHRPRWVAGLAARPLPNGRVSRLSRVVQPDRIHRTQIQDGGTSHAPDAAQLFRYRSLGGAD